MTGVFTYDINRPYQEIEHEITNIRNYLLGHCWGRFTSQDARQFNRRQEFDAHKPGSSADAGATPETRKFELTTWNMRTPIGSIRFSIIFPENWGSGISSGQHN
ncbi:MAG: hypothetical protein R2769_11410 [Saprospiraceae bacterium]